VPMPVLRASCLAMLRAHHPVFFGCDVGQFASPAAFPAANASGIMDNALIDWGLGFNVSLGLTKAQRLLTGESRMTHAMVLTGAHVVDDEEGGEKVVRWRVMNSWGAERGEKGFFVMSDGWMGEFVYQAVVGVGFVPKEVRDVVGTEAVVLPRWDPLGALA